MAKAKLMTVTELYDFAREHGYEDAQIWFPSGTNVFSSTDDARLEVRARQGEDDETPKRIYLVG